jgi:hypothetical protein
LYYPERVLPVGLSNVSPRCHSFHQLERPFERVQNVIVELLNGSLLTVSRLIEHKIVGKSYTLLITESWVDGAEILLLLFGCDLIGAKTE